MKKALLLLTAIILLGGAVLFQLNAGRWQQLLSPPAETQPAEQPLLAAVYVHGEHATAHLLDGRRHTLTAIRINGGYAAHFFNDWIADHGLPLAELPLGEYALFVDDMPLTAATGYALSGYTLTRGGVNNYYRFYEREGRLWLNIAQVSELPEQVYDIIIDAGHGGGDTGAAAHGVIEAEQNLRASLYMAELFAARGLKVALTRDSELVPGPEGADDNPYLPDGRIDRIYLSAAKYALSNHLNASSPGTYRGFQIYSSVRCSNEWATAVADGLRAIGRIENNEGKGLIEHGTYKRHSYDNAEIPRDYYFILRESGGQELFPISYLHNQPHKAALAAQGAQTLLLEYCFMDNADELYLWQRDWQLWVEAVVDACCDYWGVE
ncbi:MAG: N-acetylmuramoyl-L-alanine amidase [Bacillota bacterium]|nr:N-acetylmuramoyl-L-alanine amidase [Bacillota bacterium]